MSDFNYQAARFLVSAAKFKQCPPDQGREVAFAGRSNAGKSSAINYLTDNKKLARTSKTPGRTQLINFFAVSDDTRLVDLPGYGYAKVPQAMRLDWHREIDNYLRSRCSLTGVVLLMDCRHPLREFDEMMLAWAGQVNLPLHILLTKADKLGKGAAQSTLLKVKKRITRDQASQSVQLFSATKKQGLLELRHKLDTWLAG